MAPGRLGDPDMSLATDPRLHPQLLEALQRHGLHEPSYLTSRLTPDAPISEICRFVSANEAAIETLYHGLDYAVADGFDSIPLTTTTESVPGPDGNAIRLRIHRPTACLGQPLPCVVYFHGGGMVILRTENPAHTSWAEALARTGLVAVLVDFRNALSPDGQLRHPFPAGLDDCAAAVRWLAEHRARLGIAKVVLQGESGGANLALAAALRAKREGWLDGVIDGVCASVPYISGAYDETRAWRARELPSLVECDGYLISCATSALNAKLYDPSGRHRRDPLAWPYWASEEELRGLPPHLIVTSELDPLRDEGHAYGRKLARAGVRVVGRMNLGVIHEGEFFLRQVLPDLFMAGLWEIHSFASRV